MSASRPRRRSSSDPEIDISWPRGSLPMRGVAQWFLWVAIFVTFFTLTAFFEFDLVRAFLVTAFVALLGFAGWFVYVVVVQRGMLTWMRQAWRPMKEMARGNPEAAERACAAALERARRFAPNDHRRGLMLSELAQYVKLQGRYSQALELFEESVDILGRDLATQPMDYFITLNNYAICFIHLKDHASAQHILEEIVNLVLATHRRNTAPMIAFGDMPSIEFVLHLNLAFLFIEMRELAEARLHLEDADALLPTVPRRTRAAYGDHHIAIWSIWLCAAGAFAEAEAELARAKDPDYPACLRTRARLCLVRQDFAGAESALRRHRALEAKRGTLHRPEFVEHVVELAEAQFGLGEHDAAFASLSEARRIVADFELPRDADWQRTLEVWRARARQLGRDELAAALQREADAAAPTPSQAIQILDSIRARRPLQ